MKILIVENDSVVRDQLAALLRKEGYEVAETADGHAALDLLQQPTAPGLAIVNSDIPAFNAQEFSSPTNARRSFPHSYVVMLTSNGDRPVGADDYLAKPIDPEVLLGRITVGRSIIEKRERQAALATSPAGEGSSLPAGYQELVTLLDSLDAVVYAADMQTHEMLFMNSAARAIAGGNVGDKCWQVMQSDQTGPCEFCSNDKLLDADGQPAAEPYVWEIQNSVNGIWYQCRDQAIRWKDGRLVRLEVATNINDRIKVEEALRASEEGQRTLSDASFEAILLFDEGICVSQNLTAQKMFGHTQEEAVGRPGTDWVIPADRELVLRRMLAGYEQPYEVTALHKDGSTFPIEAQGRMISYRGRQVRMTALRDISQRKLAEEMALAHEQRFKVFFSSVKDAIFVHPLREEGFAPFIEVNDTACRHYGYSREEFLQLTAHDITKQQIAEQYAIARSRKRLLETKQQVFEAVHIKKSGEEFPVEVNSNIVEQFGKPVILSVVRDITERRLAEQEIEYMAFYDALTDLPNRFLFMEQLRLAVQNYKRDKQTFAVHMLDLDHFKDVNDSLGHPVGDALLAAVANRIKQVVRGSDVLARMGGDEFVLIQSQFQDLADVSSLAEKIIEEVSQDFEIKDHSIWINVSIGIVVNDQQDVTVNELLSQVDSALYKAKDAGRGTYAFYEDAMTLSLQRELEVTRELVKAVEKDELRVEYQPQIDLADGGLVGVEALVRWQHPKRGKLYPGDFLAIAEKRGLIRDLSTWVMGEACRQSKVWSDEGLSFGRIAVNLCAQQVTFKGFEAEVLKILQETGADPKTLEFEFTETVLIDATEVVMRSISNLSKRGISFAIDDFGTGFSSLSYLRKFETDKLKIDREFTRDILSDPGAEKIVSATIALGKNLGMVTLAEGVETPEQEAVLKQHGCDMAQGFYYGRSMPPEEIELRWLKKELVADR